MIDRILFDINLLRIIEISSMLLQNTHLLRVIRIETFSDNKCWSSYRIVRDDASGSIYIVMYNLNTIRIVVVE